MLLNNIEDIVSGMQVFMPSGLVGIISLNDDGNIIVEYRDEMDSMTDTYTQDEFGNLIADGVEVFEEPSQMIMENKIEVANKLDRIAKTNKDVKIRQEATSLLDAMNLGVDERDNVHKFFKKVDKEKKHETKTKENKMSILSKMTEQLNKLINEVSDETVEKVHVQRAMNLDKARDNEKKKFKKYAKARNNFEKSNLDDEKYNKHFVTKKATKTEWDDARDELYDAESKYDKNTDLTIKRAIRKANTNEAFEDEDLEYEFRTVRRNALANPSLYGGKYTDKNIAKARKEFFDDINKSNKNEEFVDEMSMLTDVNDLDFPTALQNTVETDEEGELLTLGKISDQINDLKDEIIDQIEDVKSDLKDEIEDVEDEIEDSEFTDEELSDLEDIEFIEDEPIEDEENNEENSEVVEEEIEDDENEESLEESLKPYLKTGKYEDLNKTKSAIDKAINSGKSAENVKNTIRLMAKDDKEADEASEYAVSKLKESLLATSKTSKLQNL